MLRAIPVYILMGLLAATVLSACTKPRKANEGKNPKDTLGIGIEETTTAGSIRIGIDETMEPVLKQWVDAFHSTYDRAHFEVWYKPEAALMRDLLADSIRLAVVGRDWTTAERQVIRKAKIVPRTNQLGTDAVALIVNIQNPIDSISFAQLQSLLKGEFSNWQGLGDSLKGDIALAFDNSESGIVRYVQDHLIGQGQPLPKNAFTAGGTSKVIDYVAESKTAIGFVGLPWLSDEDRAQVREDFKRIKYMRIISPDTVDLPGVAVGPYPNEIALSRYPLRRGIYALSREHFTGLGTGFVAFAAGERGQRILLKAGLLPEFMPPRYVILPEKEEMTKK